MLSVFDEELDISHGYLKLINSDPTGSFNPEEALPNQVSFAREDPPSKRCRKSNNRESKKQ